MKKNLSGSISAGSFLGCIFGLFSHTVLALFLASGPHPGYLTIPRELWEHMYLMAILCGVLPGFVLGFSGGIFAPFTLMSGSFSLLIGAAAWITCTGFTWFAYWDSVMKTSSLWNMTSIAVTALSFFAMYHSSEKIGSHFERLRHQR